MLLIIKWSGSSSSDNSNGGSNKWNKVICDMLNKHIHKHTHRHTDSHTPTLGALNISANNGSKSKCGKIVVVKFDIVACMLVLFSNVQCLYIWETNYSYNTNCTPQICISMQQFRCMHGFENLAQTVKKRPKFPVCQFDFPCNHHVLFSLSLSAPITHFFPFYFLVFQMSGDVVVIVAGGTKMKSVDYNTTTDNGVLSNNCCTLDDGWNGGGDGETEIGIAMRISSMQVYGSVIFDWFYYCVLWEFTFLSFFSFHSISDLMYELTLTKILCTHTHVHADTHTTYTVWQRVFNRIANSTIKWSTKVWLQPLFSSVQ